MNYSMSFGKLSKPAPARQGVGATFGLVVLGDFSGRANRGELETGAGLASRKPRRVDVDNLDDVLASMQLKLALPIGDEGAAVEISLSSIDGFHPNELYENVALFSKLAGFRKHLENTATFQGLASQMQAWANAGPADGARRRVKPRGTAIPNAKLSDFQRLTGATTAAATDASVGELIKQIVRPHIKPHATAEQAETLATIDASLTAAMRRLLHHPDFQTLEALWRTIDLLVRELETDQNLQIILYDVTAEEIAADLSSSDNLEETGLYQLLVEQPALDGRTTPPSAIVGNYRFELTPPHAELLGRMAKIAAAAQAPFIANIGVEVFEKKKPEEIHPLVAQSWDALRGLPEACYLGLATPRFMLRWPYGARTEPIDPFPFEEFTAHFGLKGFLWGNSSNLAGLMLARTFQEQGMGGMQLGSVMVQGDLPVYYYVDQDGDQIALPCTEKIASEAAAAHIASQGFIPVVWMRGRPEVRLGNLCGLNREPLAGPWAPVDVSSGAPQPIASASGVATPVATETAPVADEASAEAALDEADDELDDLLGSLEDDAPAAETASDEASDDAEDDDLDALLASIEGDGEADDEDSDSEEMDDELAALLADL